MPSLGALRVAFPLIAALLLPLEAASWLIAGTFGGRDEIFNWVSLASVLFVLFATLLACRSARAAEQTRHASRAAPR
jgi:hypothetical protein